ncbi:MAG TPA: hypothetical protein VID72_12110, partial [Ktedonobacterales bacterium]
YLAVPNSGEIDATLTNAQWHFALAMLLIVIGSAPTSRWARWFDYALFVVGGLTGPFCLFMAPLIAIAWWMNRRPSWLLRLWIIDIAAAVIQLISLLYLSPHERSPQLGMDAPLLARLIGGQIGLGLTVGSWGYALVAPHHFWQAGLAPWVVTIAVIAVFVVALLKAPWQLRLVIVFVAMQLGGALFLGAGPQGIEAAWGALATPTFGARYYVAPILALGCCLIWLATQARWKAAQWLALSALLLTLLVGIPHDWGYTPYQDNHWRYYAAQFDALPPGAQIAIPINPGWQLHLIKQ